MNKLSNITNHKEFHIKCESAEQRVRILDMLMLEGMLWHGEHSWKTGEQVEQSYPFRLWPTIGIGYEGRKNFINGRSDILVHNLIEGKIFIERYYDE